ncbi:MAG: FkbM family methyltransferase [Gammaproteobacteria bacterium]|nr:FkbM family methyltransferase [Gammaproteobacteria bacterium]
MFAKLKAGFRWAIRKAGYDVVSLRTKATHEVKVSDRVCDPFDDLKKFLGRNESIIVLDVGANSGQSIRKFKDAFPHCTVHAFEPSLDVFGKLQNCARDYENVVLNNVGAGSESGKIKFYENLSSDMSSFLEPGEFAWGSVVSTTVRPVVKLDDYCSSAGIKTVNVLKIDTQGFDYNVLLGAKRLIESRRIQLILLEIIFSEMYKDTPEYYKIFEFLHRNRFELVSLYNLHRQNGVLSWADALFINRGLG